MRIDFWRGGATRLLGGLQGNPLPAFDSLPGGGGEMGIGAARDCGDDAGNAELGTLFNSPLHAVEFEDGKEQGYWNRRRSGNFFGQIKLNPAVAHRNDSATADGLAGGDIEILADASAQDADQMFGMSADKGSAIRGDFVGYPAAARHESGNRSA